GIRQRSARPYPENGMSRSLRCCRSAITPCDSCSMIFIRRGSLIGTTCSILGATTLLIGRTIWMSLPPRISRVICRPIERIVSPDAHAAPNRGDPRHHAYRYCRQRRARLLNVSSPGVSRVMKHAEFSVGVRLFSRRGGRYSPTPQANAIFSQINGVYDKSKICNLSFRGSSVAPIQSSGSVQCPASLTSWCRARLPTRNQDLHYECYHPSAFLGRRFAHWSRTVSPLL